MSLALELHSDSYRALMKENQSRERTPFTQNELTGLERFLLRHGEKTPHLVESEVLKKNAPLEEAHILVQNDQPTGAALLVCDRKAKEEPRLAPVFPL